MAGVGFEAFAFTVVPQFEGVVERGGQNVFTVGWEFDKRYWRIVVVDKRFQTLAGRSVPNTAVTNSIFEHRWTVDSVVIGGSLLPKKIGSEVQTWDPFDRKFWTSDKIPDYSFFDELQ